MALISVNQFKALYNGKRVDVDGYPSYNKYQCWDLAAKYSMRVAGVPSQYSYGLPSGNGCACGCYSLFQSPLPKYYKRIYNAVSALPKRGDLIIWRCSLPGSGGCGHIAIVLSATWSGFKSLDQNWNGNYAHVVSHNWNYVVGWLRPLRKVNY